MEIINIRADAPDMTPEEAAAINSITTESIIEAVGEGAYVPVYHEFTRGGVTWRYGFDLLAVEQIMLASSVFALHNQQLNRLPRDMREFELSGRMDYLASAFRYMLVKVAPDGTLVPWSKATKRMLREEAEDFFLSLPGVEWPKLEECKADFFTRTNIVDVESLMQLAPIIESSIAAASTQVAAETKKEERPESNTKRIESFIAQAKGSGA